MERLSTPICAFDTLIDWVNKVLREAGLSVRPSFSLTGAPHAEPAFIRPACICPHQIVEDCTCHMTVLLAYDDRGNSAPLIAYGYDGHTAVYLADNPSLSVRPETKRAIVRAFQQAADLTNENN